MNSDPVSPPPAEGGAHAAAADSVFLAAVVLLSALPWVGGLGLYSDDWFFLSSLHDARAPFRDVLDSVMGPMAPRPVHGLLLAVLYSLFGMNITAWHVANAFTLAAIVLLFYHSLRLLRVPRVVALVAPLLFGLLPHYSTDRVWIAAFQAHASVLLYFTSLYADTRFVMRPGGVAWAWKLLGSAALAASVLAYEVTGALFVVNVAVLLFVLRRRSADRTLRTSLPSAAALVANVLVLAATVAYKLSVTERAGVSGGLRFRVLRIFTEAAPVHFGEYGVAMPMRVVQALRHYFDGGVLAVSILVGAAVAAYLLLVVRPAVPELARGVKWGAVVLAGAALFIAGYGVALMTWEVGFHTTGPNNRTAVGAAIGVAWVFAGVFGWFASRLPRGAAGWPVFAVLVALTSAGSTLLMGTVAGFWVRASHVQADIVATLRQHVGDLPPGTTLLLDGVCPFVGPAPVFATDWDAAGMLRLEYGDMSLGGDVIRPNTEVTAEGVRTQIFDDWINVYPYGSDLMAFHVARGETFTLSSYDEAAAYFAAVSVPYRAACPPYTDGDGVDIF